MPAVSAGNKALLRTEGHKNEVRLAFFVPPVLWKARVNDGTIVKGQVAIPFDTGSGGHFSKIEALQEVWVGSADGDDDIARLRIKSISSGDGGVTGTVTVAGHSFSVPDNGYLTFKHDYPLKPKFSFIDTNENWFMDDDVPYTDQHSEPPPVVIAGPDRAEYLDESTGQFVFNVDASDSYAIASGATISSYSLAVVSTAATAAVAFNTGTGAGTITFDTPGSYWAKYGVTDSNGKTQFSYRLYMIYDPDVSANAYPWVDCESVMIEDNRETGGKTAVIVANDNALLTDIPDHALCIIWQTARYGATTKNITHLPDENSAVFVGFVREDTDAEDMGQGFGDVELRLSTINGRLARLFAFSTSLIVKNGTPTDWYEYEKWQTCGTIIHDLLLWRTTVMERVDVIGLKDNTLNRIFQAFDEGNIYDNANNFLLQEGIRARITADYGNRLHVSEEQQLMIDADRSGLITIMELQQTAGAADYGNAMTIPRRQENDVPFVTANGIYWDGNTWDAENKPLDTGSFCSIAPGGKPLPDGPEPQDFPRQTVSSQAHLNQIAGRYLAQLNNKIAEVTLEFHGSYNTVLDTAYSEQFTMSLQASENSRGITWSNKPLYLKHVQSIYDAQIGSWMVSASFEPESTAEDGLTTECPSFPELGGAVPPLELPEDVPGALIDAASINFKPAQSDLWDQRLTENVLDMVQDPRWRIRTGSNAPSNAIVWRCGTGYIKRSTDAFATTDVDVTPAGPLDGVAVANIDFIEVDGLVAYAGGFVCLGRYEDGGGWTSWLLNTMDDGATWAYTKLGIIDTGSLTLDSAGSPQTAIAFDDSQASSDQFYLTNRSVHAVALSPFKVIIVYGYQQSGSVGAGTLYNTNRLFANVGTIDPAGQTITWGSFPITVFDSGSTTAIPLMLGLYPCDASTALLCYSYLGFTRIVTLALTVDKGNCMDGAHYELEAFQLTSPVAGARVSTNKLVLYYGVGGTQWLRYVEVFPPSGVSLYGRQDTGFVDGSYKQVVALTDTLLGFSYSTGSIFNSTLKFWHFAARRLGSVFSVGAVIQNTHFTNTFGLRAFIARQSTTRFMSFFSDVAEERALVCSLGVSGTLAPTTTLGSVYSLLLAAVFRSPSDISAINVAEDQNLLYYRRNTTPNSMAAVPVTWSGAAGSFGSEMALMEYPSGQDFDTAVKMGEIGAGQFFVYYKQTDSAADFQYLRMIIADYSAAFSASVNFKALAGQVDRRWGVLFWITAWSDTDELYVLLYDNVLFQNVVVPLGSCTEAQLDAKTYIAYPTTPYGVSGTAYIYGRMNNPQGLGSPVHIIRTLDYGTTWELIEDGWDFEHCGALLISLDGQTFAIRNQAAKATLYKDNGDSILVAKATLPFDAQVARHGMHIDLAYNELHIASAAADPVMVIKMLSPYLTWTDLTFDHDNTEGVVAITKL